jgi:hypothetical protein
MKSVIKCSYKANVGAGSGAGAETFKSRSRSGNKKFWLHNTGQNADEGDSYVRSMLPLLLLY